MVASEGPAAMVAGEPRDGRGELLYGADDQHDVQPDVHHTRRMSNRWYSSFFDLINYIIELGIFKIFGGICSNCQDEL